MKGINQQGQAVYYNVVTKHGKVRYQIQAASGQTLQGRDRQKRKSIKRRHGCGAMGIRYADRLLPAVKTAAAGTGGIFVYPLFLSWHRGQEKSPRRGAGALPCIPYLFREGFPGERIKQLPEGRAEYQLCSTGEERNKEIFITYFFTGH